MEWTEFAAAAKSLGVVLTEQHRRQFELYAQMLLDCNQKFNLTAIVDEREIWRKHFLDSLSPLMLLPAVGSGVDVGSGAGFPGIPLAIVCPQMKLVLMDSLKKRVGFLQEVIARLELSSRVAAVHGRVEDFAQQEEYREVFDFAVSRGVAKLVVLCELALPFVKEGGVFLAMKGPRALAELGESDTAIGRLGGGKARVVEFVLPGGTDERSLVLVPKNNKCPARYPRQAGLPEKKPLL